MHSYRILTNCMHACVFLPEIELKLVFLNVCNCVLKMGFLKSGHTHARTHARTHIHTYTKTHTQTHRYVYIYIYILLSMLVPNSRNRKRLWKQHYNNISFKYKPKSLSTVLLAPWIYSISFITWFLLWINKIESHEAIHFPDSYELRTSSIQTTYLLSPVLIAKAKHFCIHVISQTHH